MFCIKILTKRQLHSDHSSLLSLAGDEFSVLQYKAANGCDASHVSVSTDADVVFGLNRGRVWLLEETVTSAVVVKAATSFLKVVNK